VFHSDRVEHFHCVVHEASGCRICMEVGHAKPSCEIIDLYNDDDPKVIEYNYKKYGDGFQNQKQNPFSSKPNQFSGKPELFIGNARWGKNQFKFEDQNITPRMDEVAIDPALLIDGDLSASYSDFINSQEINNLGENHVRLVN
jgi:hypothetical protein